MLYICTDRQISPWGEKCAFFSKSFHRVVKKNSEHSLSDSLKIATVAETDDAVGVLVPGKKPEIKQWYIAIVGNNSERICRDKLEERIARQPADAKDYEVYVAIRKELRVRTDGKRRTAERILFPAMLFIRCTEKCRREEIVRLPCIKRFMVDVAAKRTDSGMRSVAVIPDSQMRSLKRMLNDGENDVTIEPLDIPLGAKVRVNGGKLMGLEGRVLETGDGKTNLVIRVDMLGCARMEIDRGMLEVMG